MVFFFLNQLALYHHELLAIDLYLSTFAPSVSYAICMKRLFIREEDQTIESFFNGLRNQVASRTFGGHFFVTGGTLILTGCKFCSCHIYT